MAEIYREPRLASTDFCKRHQGQTAAIGTVAGGCGELGLAARTVGAAGCVRRNGWRTQFSGSDLHLRQPTLHNFQQGAAKKGFGGAGFRLGVGTMRQNGIAEIAQVAAREMAEGGRGQQDFCRRERMKVFQQRAGSDVARTHCRGGCEGENERLRETLIRGSGIKMPMQAVKDGGHGNGEGENPDQEAQPDPAQAEPPDQQGSEDKAESKKPIRQNAQGPGAFSELQQSLLDGAGVEGIGESCGDGRSALIGGQGGDADHGGAELVRQGNCGRGEEGLLVEAKFFSPASYFTDLVPTQKMAALRWPPAGVYLGGDKKQNSLRAQ